MEMNETAHIYTVQMERVREKRKIKNKINRNDFNSVCNSIRMREKARAEF